MAGKNKEAGQRKTVAKATVTGTAASDTSLDQLYASVGKVDTIAGVLDPPYDPARLVRLSEMSSVLPQHVEAIFTNVDSYGHKFEPAIELESADTFSRVRMALIVDRLEQEESNSTTFQEPSDEEVNALIQQLKRRAAFELNKAQNFFAACNPDYSFIELRTRMRLEERITGNAYFEVLRDQNGKPSRLVLAPTVNIRLLPRDPQPTLVDEQIHASPLRWKTVAQHRYFRRYAEVDIRHKRIRVYFKEYGDPRVISQQTGKIYPDMAAFLADKDKSPTDAPATEMLHFSIPAASGPYGVPQWVGNLPGVLGSRELDEVNLAYFENRTVPPLALLVNGGRLAKGVVGRIEEFIEQQVKGKKNFHKILIIEAEGQKTAGGTSGIVPSIKFEPLREAQQQDALFQKYDENNWDKIASSFRLPRILIGRDRAINRATALAALRFAEEQVFEPIRNRFDEMINRKILPDLGISFWRFKSLTPTTRDPEMLAEIIATLSDSGVLTSNEGRAFATDVFNRMLPMVEEAWGKKPMKLILAELKNGLTKPPELGGEASDDAGAKPAGGRRSLRERRLAEEAETDDGQGE